MCLCAQERVQADLQAERVGDGDHLGDARFHPCGGSAVYSNGAHHSFHIWPVVSAGNKFAAHLW